MEAWHATPEVGQDHDLSTESDGRTEQPAKLAEIPRQPGGLKAAAEQEPTTDWDIYEEWLSESFDPDIFKRDSINAALDRIWGE
jgi:hypothetical protein